MALLVAAARAYRTKATTTGRRQPRDDAQSKEKSNWSVYRMDRNGSGHHV